MNIMIVRQAGTVCDACVLSILALAEGEDRLYLMIVKLDKGVFFCLYEFAFSKRCRTWPRLEGKGGLVDD